MKEKCQIDTARSREGGGFTVASKACESRERLERYHNGKAIPRM